eukprot:1383289-Prorocentrum_lima.AAC.1
MWAGVVACYCPHGSVVCACAVGASPCPLFRRLFWHRCGLSVTWWFLCFTSVLVRRDISVLVVAMFLPAWLVMFFLATLYVLRWVLLRLLHERDVILYVGSLHSSPEFPGDGWKCLHMPVPSVSW